MTLVAVQGSIRLESRAAAAWKAMVADCRGETGVTLRITSPYGGHRTLAQQWAMWRDRSTSTNGKVAWPGTSVHGSGRCVDVNNWGLVDGWLRANAREYGFSRTIAGEPWHFQHNGTTYPAGGGSAYIPELEEDDMARMSQAHYDEGGVRKRIAFVPGTPWYLEWNEGGSAITNGLKSSQVSGNSIPITKSMRDAIVAAANRVQTPN
jgi:hypothetical protein